MSCSNGKTSKTGKKSNASQYSRIFAKTNHAHCFPIVRDAVISLNGVPAAESKLEYYLSLIELPGKLDRGPYLPSQPSVVIFYFKQSQPELFCQQLHNVKALPEKFNAIHALFKLLSFLHSYRNNLKRQV